MTLFERIMLWGSTLLVGASGVVYGVMKYFMTTDDPYAVINHPLQPLFLKIHIVSAPLLVFAVGIVFTQHIWKQYRSDLQRSRRSGVWLLMALAPMVLSGYLIQTVTGKRVLFWLVAVHLATSVIYLLGFGAHQVVNSLWERERRRRRESRATALPALERGAARESAVSDSE
jgi:uncharacterized membrane protein YfcA